MKVLSKMKYVPSEFDKELQHDPHQVSVYAMEIFKYLKYRGVNEFSLVTLISIDRVC